MKTNYRKISWLIIGLMILSGCGVSKKVYQESQDNLAKAGAQNQSLSKDLAAANEANAKEVAGLKQTIGELEAGQQAQAKEIADLKEKAAQLDRAKQDEIEKLKATHDSLVKELEGEIKKGEIKVTQVKDKLSVNMVEKILFDSGSVDIKPEGLKVLERVGEILKNVKDKQINVEEYTDDVPIGSKLASKFPTNWELSTARAVNVVRYLEDKVKLDPKMLSASGFAMNHPVAGNDTKEGKAQNRRIEIVLLPVDIDQVLQELK
jgi:chemotaxis protein MotB